MLFRHYIWDFDGTLFDSYPHIIACFQKILAEEKIVCDREALALRFYDNFGAARRWSGISDAGYRRFTELHYRMGADEVEPRVRPFPEIREILEKIAAAGGSHYVYTNRNETARLYCEQYGLDSYFRDYISTSADGFPGKPAPDALLALMERYSLKKEECVMIGDREIDGLSGLNAGMAGCLATDVAKNANGDDPLAVSAMPYKCRSLRELLPLFEIE